MKSVAASRCKAAAKRWTSAKMLVDVTPGGGGVIVASCLSRCECSLILSGSCSWAIDGPSINLAAESCSAPNKHYNKSWSSDYRNTV